MVHSKFVGCATVETQIYKAVENLTLNFYREQDVNYKNISWFGCKLKSLAYPAIGITVWS